MDINRIALFAGALGFVVIIAFLTLGGDIEIAMRNGIFWAGIMLLLFGASSSRLATWAEAGQRLMLLSIIPLAVGYAMSTAAIVVGVLSLAIGVLLVIWSHRGSPGAKHAK